MVKPIKITKGRKRVHRPNDIAEVWSNKKGLIGEEDWSGGTLRKVRLKKSKLRGDWSKWKK